MPQMMPMNWFLIFLMILFINFFSLSIIYFNKKNTIKLTSTKLNFKMLKTYNWMW